MASKSSARLPQEPERLEPLVEISRWLSKTLSGLEFAPPVTHVYDPLVYARAPHEAYLRRYGKGTKRALLLGMNPGPFGMAQTGVPFGDVEMVRDWLGIQGRVNRPTREHPKRPITGFECRRSEVSGSRLWGFMREAFGEPERLFEHLFVVNYCPLVFMEESGKNHTPDKLPAGEREPVYAACDEALRRVARTLGATHVIGIGAFAEKRAAAALAGMDVTIATLLHPSPANPRANRGWHEEARRVLGALGLLP